MAIIPGLTVTAPEPIRRRYGLFDAANGPLDLPPHGEGGGVRYIPVTCGEAHAYGINCADDLVLSPDKPLDGDSDEVSSGSFSVLSTLNCGAVGYTTEESRTKVRRILEGSEQWAVENAFWTGQDRSGNDINILNLEDSATAIFPGTGGTQYMATVLATLEEYAYFTQGYGYPAYIHAPSLVAPYAARDNLIVMDGNRKVTPNGSIWVFGGGYPGTGAGGAGSWPSGGYMHITGQTTVWRSPEIQVYDSFQNQTNERLVVAERAYAVTFECLNARIEFNPLNIS